MSVVENMSGEQSFISKVIKGNTNIPMFKDIYFWLLLVCINIGGNPGFSYIIREQISLILITGILYYRYFQEKKSFEGLFRLLLPICIIIIIQGLSLPIFAINTSIHYAIKISMGILIVSLCGDNMPRYFSSIIFVYAVISLICFCLNFLGIIVPFLPVSDEITIDDGNVFRVYSLIYTQLYNPLDGGGLTLRNCGPFWEPGAYQGFLNLALWFELTMKQLRDGFFKFRVVVFLISIVTTVSTGGYIVMGIIIVHFLIRDCYIPKAYSVLVLPIFLVISIYCYESLDFLKAKIANDTIRTSFNFFDTPDSFTLLLGYGLSVESLSESSMQTVNSLYNLFNYFGVLGFLIFVFSFWRNKTPYPLAYFFIVSLILMNEPFLSNVPLFWGLAFVEYYHDEFENNLICEY